MSKTSAPAPAPAPAAAPADTAPDSPPTTPLAAAVEAMASAEPQKVDKPSLEIGQTVRLRAVYGFIQNPNTLVDFNIDKSHKVTVDMWTKLEYEAGKLAIDD